MVSLISLFSFTYKIPGYFPQEKSAEFSEHFSVHQYSLKLSAFGRMYLVRVFIFFCLLLREKYWAILCVLLAATVEN